MTFLTKAKLDYWLDVYEGKANFKGSGLPRRRRIPSAPGEPIVVKLNLGKAVGQTRR